MKNLILAAALLVSSPAGAAICMPLEIAERGLDAKFQELQIAEGYSDTADMPVRLYLSPSMSYTIVTITPEGYACFLASGKDWHWVEVKPRGEGL